MKRFAPLALIVLALALIPAAFADDGTPTSSTTTTTTTATTTQPNAGRGNAANVRIRVEVLRLRLQIVRLRFRLHCGPHGTAPQDKCVAFAQKVEDRLTKLDGNVQQKIAGLKACASDSAGAKCKNADKKIALLTRIDTHLQRVIQSIQNWINGKSSESPSSTSDSSLDQAASDLSQAAGSNG
ncbi:MAG TPA: hypothetical protein VGH82_09760 [Gaiellaceae bacterium]|jgi:hypothetical protein